MFIFYLIDIIHSFFSVAMFNLFFVPALCLAFLATVPFIIMRFIRR